MPDLEGQRIASAAAALRLRYLHAPAIDILDEVMDHCTMRFPVFADPSSPGGALTAPQTDLGQLIAEAFDRGMDPQDWRACTSPSAHPALRHVCLNICAEQVLPKFAKRYQLWDL